MNLESLLAFVGIMLGLSLAITIANQMVSNALTLRGRALSWGLTTVLKELHPPMQQRLNGVGPLLAASVSKFVLTHDLVTDSSMPSVTDLERVSKRLRWLEPLVTRYRLSTALRFEELQRILQFNADATQADPDPAQASIWSVDEARRWLSRNLVVNSDSFQSMMDRVSQRFAMGMRLWTIGFAFLLAGAFHVDTFNLFSQLSRHPESAAQINTQLTAIQGALDNEGRLSDDSKVLQANLGKLKATIDGSEIRVLPDWNTHERDVYGKSSAEVSLGDRLQHFLGILLTAALLSLGAPFWFNQLRNVSSLRTVLAQNTAKPKTDAPIPAITWQEK